MASTPTLFNAGTTRRQLSSCFLTTVDDVDNILQSVKHDSLLAEYSGGLGNDWTPVRGIGADIKGTNGLSWVLQDRPQRTKRTCTSPARRPQAERDLSPRLTNECRTTYYLRSTSATHVEKSTLWVIDGRLTGCRSWSRPRKCRPLPPVRSRTPTDVCQWSARHRTTRILLLHASAESVVMSDFWNTFDQPTRTSGATITLTAPGSTEAGAREPRESPASSSGLGGVDQSWACGSTPDSCRSFSLGAAST